MDLACFFLFCFVNSVNFGDSDWGLGSKNDLSQLPWPSQPFMKLST